MAAYKLIEVARALTQRGFRVPVILSESATHFVTPLSFRALTSEPVHVSGRDRTAPPVGNEHSVESNGTLMPHLRSAWESHVVLVAPATADTISRLHGGRADDLLSATVLAASAPVLIAPAMNDRMYASPATQRNIAGLVSAGMRILGPETGSLASGHQGKGRLMDTDAIVQAVEHELSRRRDLVGKKILITSGPTHEPIDPVRFISNRSSGRMGHALAYEAQLRGAQVTVISGPTDLLPVPGAETLHVETAQQMDQMVRDHGSGADVIILAAAVADVSPVDAAPRKLKRASIPDSIALETTPDVLSGVVDRREPGQFIIGFAAETQNLLASAQAKCAEKGVDLIVANDVSRADIGFGAADNEVLLVSPDGRYRQIQKAPKAVIASAILDEVASSRL